MTNIVSEIWGSSEANLSPAHWRMGQYLFSTAPIVYVTFFDCLYIFRICLHTWWEFTPQITSICYHPFPNYRGWNFHPFSPPMPVRGREVRFNRAPYLRYYQSTHFAFIGFCCKKIKLSFEISLKKIKSARMIEKVK